MKKVNIYRKLAFASIIAIAAVSCTKEMSEVRLDPEVETNQSMTVQAHSAQVEGFIVAEGDGFIEKGICYNTSPNPLVTDNKTAYTGDETNAAFTVTLEGLQRVTKYYARAYALNEGGVIYGEEITFTTIADIPTLTTVDITDITGSSASGGGNVTDGGGVDVTARGICFGTEENPTVASSKTSDGEGVGEFVSALTDLMGNTTYYVRAYATNNAGTGYGPQVTFTTLVDLPKVTTAAVTAVTKTSAQTGGEVTYDGGAEVTARGIVWGTAANPTLDNNVVAGGTGTGAFVSELAELTKFTTYHVRAFATNSAGTAYGEDIEFTTLADITKFWVVGSYNGWDNSDNAEYIISTATSEGLAEGYVYLTSGGIKLTTDHSWGDASTFGDDGAGGLTNPGSDITVPADGYYRIRANLSDMTYSLVKTDWGVIGDATPLEWNGETPLTYDAASKTWRGVVHFTVGGFKFRAGDWAYNYGSSDGVTLVHDGSNIAVDTEADYAIVLDLSVPNEYTYTAHRWGVIGDATPGEWSTDTDMTWDALNGVFTVTVNLVGGKAFKFRANDDWGVNYGGALDALTPGGDNITVAEDGNYTITFDPWGLVATLTKN